MSSASKCQRTISFRRIIIRRLRTSRLSLAAVHAGMGGKLDVDKGQSFAPGGFVSMPAGTPNHYAWATTETRRASARRRPVRDRLCQSGRRSEQDPLTV